MKILLKFIELWSIIGIRSLTAIKNISEGNAMKTAKKFLALLLALTLVLALAACGGNTEPTDEEPKTTDPAATEPASSEDNTDNDTIKVAWSLKTLQEERWQKELEGVEAACADLGVELIYQVANGDAQTQIAQAENMMSQGIDVLMVTPADAGAMANTLMAAHEEGIKVLIYDNQLDNCYGDVFVGYNDFTQGGLIAQILVDQNVSGNIVMLHGDQSSSISRIVDGEKDKISGLDVNIVMEQYCQNWAAENALAYAQNALAQYDDITAFVCMNDGIASGTIQALEEVGLAGKVVVTGMDGELTAMQRIVAGTQTSTLYKDAAVLSRTAIETAIKLAKGEEVVSDYTVNFGVNDMPHVVVAATIITKDNIDAEIIDTGIFTHEEVYGN